MVEELFGWISCSTGRVDLLSVLDLRKESSTIGSGTAADSQFPHRVDTGTGVVISEMAEFFMSWYRGDGSQRLSNVGSLNSTLKLEIWDNLLVLEIISSPDDRDDTGKVHS